MCSQRLDRLTFNGKKYRIKTDPLFSYWNEQNPQPPMGCPSTGNYRGYYSSWEIIDNVLFLIDVTYKAPKYNAGLFYVFPDSSGKIKATWFTGDLEVFSSRQGDDIYDFLDMLIDTDWFISIENGNYIGQCFKLKTDYDTRKPISKLFERLFKRNQRFQMADTSVW